MNRHTLKLLLHLNFLVKCTTAKNVMVCISIAEGERILYLWSGIKCINQHQRREQQANIVNQVRSNVSNRYHRCFHKLAVGFFIGVLSLHITRLWKGGSNKCWCNGGFKKYFGKPKATDLITNALPGVKRKVVEQQDMCNKRQI